MLDASPPSLGRSLLLWLALSLVFLLAGGIGAGVTALLYKWIVGDPFTDVLYAVLYGGIGLIAYRVAWRYAEARWEQR